MAVPFSPRAALCTCVVVTGFGLAVTSQVPSGLFGLIGMERDGLLVIESGGVPRGADSDEIVRAVLTHEARNTDRGAVCVELADEGEALASERAEIARLQRMVEAADPATRARLVAGIDERRNPARAWVRPPTGSAEPTPFGEENVRRLQAVETALLGMPAPGRVAIMVDMGALPENLRSHARPCPVLAFTAPAVAGNIALVETHFTAAGRPEEAWLYAVVQTDGHWRTEAMARQ